MAGTLTPHNTHPLTRDAAAHGSGMLVSDQARCLSSLSVPVRDTAGGVGGRTFLDTIASTLTPHNTHQPHTS